MAENSAISWTDHTFNPWIGCTKVSPGCINCYMEYLMDTRLHVVKLGKGQPRNRTSESNWRKPLAWDRAAGRGMFRQCDVCGRREFRKWDNTLPPGGLSCCSNRDCTALPETESFVVRPRVFCASLSDWLDDEVPVQWTSDLLDLIRRTPNLDWQLLTKRPQNWRDRLERVSDRALREGNYELVAWLDKTQHTGPGWLEGNAPANVWVGTTAEDQQRYDERVGLLCGIPAAVRFLSMEPLLSNVDMQLNANVPGQRMLRWYNPVKHQIHWVIVGGESGLKARTMEAGWARGIRDQCAAVGVPFLFKQWGDNSDEVSAGYNRTAHHGGDVLDGVQHHQFPEVAHG